MNLQTIYSRYWLTGSPDNHLRAEVLTAEFGRIAPWVRGRWGRGVLPSLFSRLTGEPGRERSSSLGKHPVLSLRQLGSISFTTIPNFKVCWWAHYTGLNEISDIPRVWDLWAWIAPNEIWFTPVSLTSILPCTRTPWTHSSIQYPKAPDSLKTFAGMKSAAFSTLPQQFSGPS